MKLTLTRYAVRPGKEQLTREWMAVLNQRQAEVQETLSDEKMALEAIFMEEDAKGMALIWWICRVRGRMSKILRIRLIKYIWLIGENVLILRFLLWS